MVVTALITALAFYMMVSCIENYLYGSFTPLLRVLCGLTSVCLFFASFTTTSLQTSILMSVAGNAASLAINRILSETTGITVRRIAKRAHRALFATKYKGTPPWDVPFKHNFSPKPAGRA